MSKQTNTLNPEQIKEILFKNHGIIDPEYLRAEIIYGNIANYGDYTLNADNIGVDINELEININTSIELRDSGKIKRLAIATMSNEEIVWEEFRELLVESIKENLL